MRLTTPCFHEGNLLTAFVFSVPGAQEEKKGRPVAGLTGDNLEEALLHLNKGRNELFASLKRYDYRLTNAFAEPMAKSLGHKSSEAQDLAILMPRNLERVLNDLKDCPVVILSGAKAQLLSPNIRKTGAKTIHVCHIGNTGLNATYRGPKFGQIQNSRSRRLHRIQAWASDVLNALL